MKSWVSELSIRWILPVAVVAPVLAIALVLTLLAYRAGQRNANDLAAQSIRQIHERIEGHLNHLMELPPAINRLIGSRLSEGALALNDSGRSRSMAFETLETFPDVSSIVLGSAQGQVMWVIRYPGETTYEYAVKQTPDAKMQEYAMAADGKLGPAPISSYDYNAAIRPWYRAAIEADGPTWGGVYVWVRGGKGVTLGIPYVEPYRDAQGALLGVINCELTLADISVFLKRLQISKTGMAFIIERDGNLVATSVGIECMKDGKARLPAVEAGDPRIATAAAKLLSEPGSLAALNGIRTDRLTLDGQPAQMVVSSFRNRRNLDWVIVTLVPDVDFLADVQRNRMTSLQIGGIAVLVALAVGMLLAMWLLRPILAVVTHAKRVGKGELELRLDRHDNREISQLSGALNDMAEGLQDRMRLRHALGLAMEVQQSLLPNSTPAIKGLDVAARAKYCDETGGDYYDYINVESVGDHSLFVALGDVMGHGIAAALLMATARGVLRAQARTQGSLGQLLTHLNEHICTDTKGDRFMTMFLAVFDASTMSMRWASAGHDQPLIYDPTSGLLTEVDANGGGLPLGVMGAEVYEEQIFTGLRPGQIVLVGTDGLWESKNNAGDDFGKERVGAAMAELAHLSVAEIEAGIFQRLQKFCDGRPNHDDITYVVIKINDAPASPQ